MLFRSWRDGAMTVAVGLGGAPAVSVHIGRCVGGSSMLTGGVCFRIPEHVLDEWSRDLALPDYDPKSMERYFEHVEKAIHVETVPESMQSKSTRLFGIGADKRGLVMEPMRRNTEGCQGCGRCNFGCPHAAKLSVDLSYLPKAVAAGADVYSHCRVDRVVTRGGSAVGVRGRLLNRPGGRPGDAFVVHAKRVVVACGAWHTPTLLLRSGIGARKHVGRNMTLHPGFRMFARFEEKVRGWRGALQSTYSTSLEDQGITLTSLFIPPGVLAATMPGVGREHTDNAKRVDLMKQYQKIFTTNVYEVGLTQYPGALIINKRFDNIPAGAPIFMFNWAEDNIIRERVYVPTDKQQDYELHPKTLPGAPGLGNGPVSG